MALFRQRVSTTAFTRSSFGRRGRLRNAVIFVSHNSIHISARDVSRECRGRRPCGGSCLARYLDASWPSTSNLNSARGLSSLLYRPVRRQDQSTMSQSSHCVAYGHVIRVGLYQLFRSHCFKVKGAIKQCYVFRAGPWANPRFADV